MKVLSFGGGTQTTAISLLMANRKIDKPDLVLFSDVGAEKPETYWYIEHYMKDIFKTLDVPFHIIKHEISKTYPDNLYQYLWDRKDIPSVQQRRCTDHYKIRVMDKFMGTKKYHRIIGFSADELERADKSQYIKSFPLIDLGMTAQDCKFYIQSEGLPLPLKSSCFFCIFQKYPEWNWLKNNHPELFQKAIDLEARYHARRPDMKDYFGLLNGTPLWKIQYGFQPEMALLTGQSCWSGACGH